MASVTPRASVAAFLGALGAWIATPVTAAPVVVATILPVHALVASVMGEVGQPTLLLPPGFSEHTAALKPSEAKALADADLVVWVGEGIETLLAKPIRTLPKKTTVVTLSRDAGIALLKNRAGGLWDSHDDDHSQPAGKRAVKAHDHGKGHKHGHHDDNQHVWLDPDNAKKIVTHVAATLARIDGANAGRYAANAQATNAELDRLDAELRLLLAPARKVPFIVFHDAFPYFERRYDLNAIGSITVSPEQKPGSKRVIEIRDKLTRAKAACIFGEPQYDANLLRNLVEGTSVRIGTLDPLGSTAAPGPAAYETLMRTLATALRECLAPGAS